MGCGISTARRTASFLGSHYFSSSDCTSSPPNQQKRVSTGREHTQGFEQESQNEDLNPETHLAREHERTGTEGSPWPGSPPRERGQGSPEGSGAAPQPSCSSRLSAGSAHRCATQQIHICFPALLDWLQAASSRLPNSACPKRCKVRHLQEGLSQNGSVQHPVSSAGSH